MKLESWGEFVIIEPIITEVTEGGIVIPDVAQVDACKGKVISARGTTLKVGQTVYFNRYAGSGIDFNGKKYKVMHFKEVYAVETEE